MMANNMQLHAYAVPSHGSSPLGKARIMGARFAPML